MRRVVIAIPQGTCTVDARRPATVVRAQAIVATTAGDVRPGDLALFSYDEDVRNYADSCRQGMIAEAIPVVAVRRFR